jgi:hypothetical protein
METPEIQAILDQHVELNDAKARIAAQLAREAVRLAEGDGYLARIAIIDARTIVERIEDHQHRQQLAKDAR